MASTYLEKTFSGNGTNAYKWTFSAWLKRSNISTTQRIITAGASSRDGLVITDAGVLQFFCGSNAAGEVNPFVTNKKFKDTNAWYHIVVSADSTQSGSANQVKLYINGELDTDYSESAAVGSNTSWFLGNGHIHRIGTDSDSSKDAYWDGYMSHIHFCDGYVYQASDFGSTDAVTGEWNINTSPNVTYGTNGFFWLKDNNATTDNSPNSNTFTVGAGTLSKTEDNPSNVFATINTALGSDVIGSTVEFSSGNTLASDPNGQASGINPNFISTLGMPSKGKWYCEVQPASFSTSSGHSIGIYRTKGSTDDTGQGDLEGNNSKIRYIFADTSIYIIKYGTNDQTGLTSITSGQTVGMALDLDNGTLQYYVNGSARANQLTGINSANDGYDYFFHAGLESSSSGRYGIYKFNFGNGAFGSTQLTGTTYNDSQGRGIFKYQPPTNFLALCTKNLNV